MIERISVTRAVELIDSQDAQVVDIRDPNTYAQGHIAQARRVDNNNIHEFLAQADKTKPLVVVCYHGKSSQQAAMVFSQQGFDASYSMDGGMCEWVLTQPVVTGE